MNDTATWRNIDSVDNILYLDDVTLVRPDTVLSQYAASPRICALIDCFQQTLDACPDLDAVWYNLVNIDTATGTSLDTWGRILGVSRSLKTDSGQITWDDDQYRFLLLYKALANISSSDSATLNALLTELFGGDTFILDNQDMTIRVCMLYYASDVQSAIMQAYGLLCRGGGVGWEWYQIDVDNTFGFDGSELQPFNMAPFAVYEIVNM